MGGGRRGKSSARRNRDSDDGDEPFTIDPDVSHLTKLRSEPSAGIARASAAPGPVATIKMLAARESNLSGRGRFSLADRSHVLGRYLPVNGPWCVDKMDSRVYVSQFSADGSMFVAGLQGSQIKIYDVDRGWKLRKDILAKSLRWTITDTALSPDRRFLVYSSMSPIIHIVNVGTASTESHANITEIHEGLDLSVSDHSEYAFGIFSVKFSNDGRELVAGSSNDSIFVYDIEENRVTSHFTAHESDVNTVTFADEASHLIYSGSDDGLCKVWDRRCIAIGKPAGVLTGHLEGITFIDSRGDARYFISNGKDQTTKLWDIRKMSSKVNGYGPRKFDWDYRWMPYPPEAKRLRHSHDQSLATYRGHSVLCTLIRCYFSPAYSTGQKYIYTGSNDKCVYIYDVLTGEQVAKLAIHSSAVRDCSWHPYYPMLVTSSWDCMIARWEFPGNDVDHPLTKRRRKVSMGIFGR